jgi:hypothetical protein
LGPDLLVTTLDISETGVRVVLKSAVEKGREVELLFQGLNCGRPVKRTARVVWTVPLEDGNYCAGLHLDRPLRYIELLRLAKCLG